MVYDCLVLLLGIEPLVETFRTLSDAPVPFSDGELRHPVVFIAVIRRFAWEENFFNLMRETFVEDKVHEQGDIAIYQYTRKESAPRP